MRDDALCIAGAFARIRELQSGGRLGRQQRNRPLQSGLRRPGLPELEQAGAEQQVGWSERRVLTNGETKLGGRFRVTPALLQDDAEIVTHEGAISALADDGAEPPLGGIELTGLQCRNGVVEPRRQRRGQVLPGRVRHRQQHEGGCQR